MRLQLQDGEVLDVNPQRAKQLLREGATVVNPQSTFERQNPKARAAAPKKARKKRAAPKKKAAVVKE